MHRDHSHHDWSGEGCVNSRRRVNSDVMLLTITMQAWQSYISIAKDILTGGAALTAGIVAVLGLQAWKKQLKGKVEYELARRLLRAALNVRDAIRFVRNPLQTGGEIDHAVKEAGIDLDPRSPEYRAKSEAAVYQQRWKRLYEAMSQIEIELLEAEVSWGSEILERVKPLRACIGTLRGKLWLHSYNLEHPSYSENEAARQEREEIVQTIYWMSDDLTQDSFGMEVKTAIDGIAHFLSPYLKM
jgi:hypothetical protein